MSDPVRQSYDDTRALAQDYFGIGDGESETLMKIAKQCAMTGGVVMAGVGGVALAGVGSVTIPLIGAVPGYVAGALAGFIGGTTACMIARRTHAEQVKQILSKHGLTDQEFKEEVRRLISVAEGNAGYRPQSTKAAG